jgi:hypothetical protein
MIAAYSQMKKADVSIYVIIAAFGLFVAATMLLVQVWYSYNRRKHAEEVDRLLAFARAEVPHHHH